MKIKIKSISPKRLLLLAAMLSGGFLLIVYVCLFTSIIRARIVKVESLVKHFEAQFQNDPLKALQQSSTQKIAQKVVVQEGFNNDKGVDANCLTWHSEPVVSGWTQNLKDPDFFVDYYVPPSSKAIICTTPIFAGALTADAEKPFIYEVYRTEYGLRVRVIIGASEVREVCQILTLNNNCLNSFLQQQAIVRYKH